MSFPSCPPLPLVLPLALRTPRFLHPLPSQPNLYVHARARAHVYAYVYVDYVHGYVHMYVYVHTLQSKAAWVSG